MIRSSCECFVCVDSKRPKIERTAKLQIMWSAVSLIKRRCWCPRSLPIARCSGSLHVRANFLRSKRSSIPYHPPHTSQWVFSVDFPVDCFWLNIDYNYHCVPTNFHGNIRLTRTDLLISRYATLKLEIAQYPELGYWRLSFPVVTQSRRNKMVKPLCFHPWLETVSSSLLFWRFATAFHCWYAANDTLHTLLCRHRSAFGGKQRSQGEHHAVFLQRGSSSYKHQTTNIYVCVPLHVYMKKSMVSFIRYWEIKKTNLLKSKLFIT